MTYVEYKSNNSGGNWWLTDENWMDLEKAGWKVNWEKDNTSKFFPSDESGRWLGALATSATLPNTSIKEAIKSFEAVTGLSTNAVGCSCCGPPHSFILYDDDGKSLEYWSTSIPEYGDSYE